MSRTYREWKGSTPTVPETTKVRSQLAALQPQKEQKTKIDTTHYFGMLLPEEVPIKTVIDYYFALRTLANTWGFVGNYITCPRTRR